MTKILAALIIVIFLALSRVLASLGNMWLWVRLVALKPKDAPLNEYSSQIFLSEVARKGMWPGILVYFPVFAAGGALANIDRNSFLFPVGIGISIIGAIFATGAIWGITSNVFPNKALAESRLALIDKSLEAGQHSQPLTAYRYFWRACYLWENVAAACELGGSGRYSASLVRMGTLIDQYEESIRKALSGSEQEEKLRKAIHIQVAATKSHCEETRKQLGELVQRTQKLVTDWPSSSESPNMGMLRIVQFEPAQLLQEIGIDNCNLADLIVKRKNEGTIVATDLEEAARASAGAPKGKWSRPMIGEFDILLPIAFGEHKLTAKTFVKSIERTIKVEAGRSVALISFDTFADDLTVEMIL